MSSFVSVVLSGGAGTRLWPVSRDTQPKPFMKLADGQTLIQLTYARVKALESEVLTVTNRDYYFMSLDEQARAGISGGFLLEPFGRNTAGAIGLASKYIAATQGMDAIVLVIPSDHLIADQAAFVAAVADAKLLAQDGCIATFGIVPTNPETRFGYIEVGEPLGLGNKVICFTEKPNQETADAYIASGKHVWNSGMLCFQAGVLLEDLNKYAPETANAVDVCWAAMQPPNKTQIIEIPAESFRNVPNISIDYAVMEHSDKVVTICRDFGWNDIGSWNAIRDLAEADANQNRATGEVIFIDTNNTFVRSENRLVATLGISNLMIIDTPDALLVLNPDKVEDVKQIVAQLKDCNHDSFKLHKTVLRPWGSYTVLGEAPGFKIKRIEVRPGASLSLQMHRHRSEHWTVVNGMAKITNGDSEFFIQANESAFIQAGEKHRLENPSVNPCIMIEVQCGSYLGEDDIVRFEDEYGR